MATKDYNKYLSQDNFFAEKLNKVQEKNKAEADKRNKYITTSLGNEFRVERWNHADCFDRLPSVANLLYVPTAVVMEDLSAEQQGITFGDVDTSITPRMLFQRMQEVEFTEFLKDCLDQTYKLRAEKPVDFEEDFVSTAELLEVVSEVLQANFMMDLCISMHQMAPILMSTGALQENLTKQPTQETSKPQ